MCLMNSIKMNLYKIENREEKQERVEDTKIAGHMKKNIQLHKIKVLCKKSIGVKYIGIHSNALQPLYLHSFIA